MKRYTQQERDWEDVSLGSSMAHSGKKLSTEHKQKITKSLIERGKNTNYVIQAVNASDPNKVQYFENGQEASEALGCSRQLVSQCLRRDAMHNYQHSAKGWILNKIYIEKEDEDED